MKYLIPLYKTSHGIFGSSEETRVVLPFDTDFKPAPPEERRESFWDRLFGISVEQREARA
jgi:hypothetical protein